MINKKLISFLILLLVLIFFTAFSMQGEKGSSMQGGTTRLQGETVVEENVGGIVLRNDSFLILRNDNSSILRN